MKLTKAELIKIIKEELLEVALCRDKDTGHFDDCSPGNVYSLTKAGAKSAGVSDEFVGRGTITKNRKLDTPYGANTSDTEQCGRKYISGADKKKDRRCRDYKAKGRYGIKEDGSYDFSSVRLVPSKRDASDKFISINDLIDVLQHIEAQINNYGQDVLEDVNPMVQKCRKLGFKTQTEYFQSLIKGLDLLKRASDGKLNEPAKS